MTHGRVALAASIVSTFIALSGIEHRSDADVTAGLLPSVVRGSLHPTGFRVTSSTPEEVRLTVSVSGLHVEPLGGRKFRLTLDGGEPLAVDGAPDLPAYRCLVAVAEGGEVTVTTRVDKTADASRAVRRHKSCCS